MDNFTNLDTAIKENIGKVLSEIACAAEKAGRNPDGIKLMAVTKTKPYQYVNAAYNAGLRLFGENRVQEMEEKYFSFHNDASASRAVGSKTSSSSPSGGAFSAAAGVGFFRAESVLS